MAVAAFVVILGACVGDAEPVDLGPAHEPEELTLAFLRAVQSNQPDNQAAFLAELEAGGLTAGDNLHLLGQALDEVYPDAPAAAAAVQRWERRGVDVIVALSTLGARTAAETAPGATVVFLVNDPAQAGVDNPRRPEGNLTGVTFSVPADRTLDVTRRAFPQATTIGVVYTPEDPASDAVLAQAKAAASALGVTIVEGPFTGAADAATAVGSVASAGASVLWVLNSPTSFRHIADLGAAALQARLPIVTNTSTSHSALVFQPDTEELYRQMARQVLRLSEGADVAEVPVENPARFELAVNLDAAAAVGVAIPPSLVSAADEVSGGPRP